MATDSFVGAGLKKSPYDLLKDEIFNLCKERSRLMKENEALRAAQDVHPDSLRAVNERLRAENEKLQRTVAWHEMEDDRVAAESQRLRAENKVMRKLLCNDQFSLKELLNEISNGRKHEVEIAAVNYQLVAILTIGNF